MDRKGYGVLITFEGIEGAGKTTQVTRLTEALKKEGYDVVTTYEPGATPLGEKIRDWIFSSSLSPDMEALLFIADRVLHWHQMIFPALEERKIVLCDRFSDSTYAYQGYGSGVSIPFLKKLHQNFLGRREPDLTILLDIPVENVLLSSQQKESTVRIPIPKDRIEKRSLEFHQKVRKGYLRLAKQNPHRFCVLDGRENPEILEAKILFSVKSLMQKHSHQ